MIGVKVGGKQALMRHSLGRYHPSHRETRGLAPRQTETRVLELCGETYLFEIVAGDLADCVRRDESQVGGAKKRQY